MPLRFVTPAPRPWRRRGVSTSPGREATPTVVKSAPAFQVLAQNVLDDGFDASPPLVGNEIFLRGYKYLSAIAQLGRRADGGSGLTAATGKRRKEPRYYQAFA